MYTSPYYYRHVSEAEVREVGGVEPSVAFHEIQVQYVESYVMVHQSIRVPIYRAHVGFV